MSVLVISWSDVSYMRTNCNRAVSGRRFGSTDLLAGVLVVPGGVQHAQVSIHGHADEDHGGLLADGPTQQGLKQELLS